MAQRIGVRELRESLTKVLRAVEAGQSYEVTRDSVVVAVLGPADRTRLERMIAHGEASVPVPLDQPIRRRPAPGRSASDFLADDREG
jgi:prevent-host-death family protein